MNSNGVVAALSLGRTGPHYSLAFVFCLAASQLASTARAVVDETVDHLVPVNEDAAPAYQAQLRAQLSVTPADVARMIVCPSWQSEFAVSVYSTSPASADDVARYNVTLTRASANIWAAGQPVQITRFDAELPASAALPIKELWKQTLLAARGYAGEVDPPVDGEIVEFALLEPNRSELRGEVPINPSGDILALQKLGSLLVSYCQATADEQSVLAKEIEANAKDLLKRKPDLNAIALQESLRITPTERKVLQQKAKKGDAKAADRLSLYYSIYRSDRKMAVHYLKLGAKNNSDAAIRNLMMLYSTDADLFDFRKALDFRKQLKRVAKTQRINLKSDADWGYDRYLDHLRAGDKRRGLCFLEYAAGHDSDKALNELIQIYSKDPDVRNPKKARYWKRKLKLRSEAERAQERVTDSG
jgi:hypothetical protein